MFLMQLEKQNTFQEQHIWKSPARLNLHAIVERIVLLHRDSRSVSGLKARLAVYKHSQVVRYCIVPQGKRKKERRMQVSIKKTFQLHQRAERKYTLPAPKTKKKSQLLL